jgi:hypothetical protein
MHFPDDWPPHALGALGPNAILSHFELQAAVPRTSVKGLFSEPRRGDDCCGRASQARPQELFSTARGSYLKNIESHALMYRDHHRPGRKVAMVCDDNGDGAYWTGYVQNAKAPKAKAGGVAYIICFPGTEDEQWSTED